MAQDSTEYDSEIIHTNQQRISELEEQCCNLAERLQFAAGKLDKAQSITDGTDSTDLLQAMQQCEKTLQDCGFPKR